MKWMAAIMLCGLVRDLFRKSIPRSGGCRCHAWTRTEAHGVLRPNALRRFRSPASSKFHPEARLGRNTQNARGCRNIIIVDTKNNDDIDDDRDGRDRPFEPMWTGDMAPFSEFATHVEVGKDDAPTTVESAILRSMTALGASFARVSEDGKSYTVAREENDRRRGGDTDATDGSDSTFVVEEKKRVDVSGSVTVGGNDAKIVARRLKDHPPNTPMTPRQLLHLGGIWHLSAEHYRNNLELRKREEENVKEGSETKDVKSDTKQRKNDLSNKSVKPSRLSLSDASMMLKEGDYLRIHHTPRRFPAVYNVDWSFPSDEIGDDSDGRARRDRDESEEKTPVAVQQEGTGYCIIDKPPIVPVHATVDNAVENVAHQLYLALEDRKQQNVTASNTDPKRNDTDAVKVGSKQQHQQQAYKPADTTYLAPVQRIDVNTSGLLVLATSPEFAGYFSELLRRKTAAVSERGGRNDSSGSKNGAGSNTTANTSPTIEKGYRCLLCIQPDSSGGGESVIDAWKRLSKLQRPKATRSSASPSNCTTEQLQRNTNTTVIIRHYLKASCRSAKLFVDTIPEDDDGDSKWYECLMELTNVGDPIPLYASNDSDASSSLTNGLWPKAGSSTSDDNRMPPTTKAVVEVEVSLITGRTHQIRGQLSKLGFPIVGDEQYGGAVPLEGPPEGGLEDAATRSEEPQLLALQCCHIGFRDAAYEPVWHNKKRREILRGRPSRSGRWVRATLEKAWWTPLLREHAASSKDGDRFSDIDFRDADDATPAEGNEDIGRTAVIDADAMKDAAGGDDDGGIRTDLLPPTVQLSPGRNKYVVARIRDPSTKKVLWFVLSAPLPYHAEVAFDLVEWIAAVPGYERTRVDVTGGGRIDYDPAASAANVYGFSYRYGKGDHERVASLIEGSDMGADLVVTYDLSDDLY
eukprot:CAMPEP_0197178242 /NCGR_PEP_ID=MMETSP1423-20130617/3585_1 /TAXON_ID=476441 /ORGANISM="Pseudo-nitzschia heimii, Strain UNC1101" /LENGTH=916 /DNA_ID=CAMNT_0042627949 /DNA_START=168 /DNA_END=2918 /DNA_ORIENTATION=-